MIAVLTMTDMYVTSAAEQTSVNMYRGLFEYNINKILFALKQFLEIVTLISIKLSADLRDLFHIRAKLS